MKDRDQDEQVFSELEMIQRLHEEAGEDVSPLPRDRTGGLRFRRGVPEALVYPSLNFYTTDVDRFFEASGVAIGRLAEAGCRPASTLLGMTRLAFPELLVEIEATAVV